MKKKLTERQLKLIKGDKVSKYKVLAERFGVSESTITNIKSGLRDVQLSLGKWGNNSRNRAKPETGIQER